MIIGMKFQPFTPDASQMHFFDETGVIKTSGNRVYGSAPVGLPALERYASNANYTVNLLHSITGVDFLTF